MLELFRIRGSDLEYDLDEKGENITGEVRVLIKKSFTRSVRKF